MIPWFLIMVLLVGLRVDGVIGWPWLLVLAPVWLPATLLSLVLTVELGHRAAERWRTRAAGRWERRFLARFERIDGRSE